MIDTSLQLARALVLLGITLALLLGNRRWQGERSRGWHLVISGFAVLLLGSLAEFVGLRGHLAIRATEGFDLLEVGFVHLAGFGLIAVGLLVWLPGIHRYPRALASQHRTETQLRAAHDALERRVEMQERDLQKANLALDQEVADRRQAENQLRASEQRLARAQQIARIGSWEQNIAGNELILSDEIHRLLGLRERGPGHNLKALFEYIHPDDRVRVRQAIRTAIRTRQPLNLFHRVMTADQRTLTVHQQAEVTYDPAGKPLVMSGTMQDVTEAKKAEEVLQVREGQLRQLQSISGIGVFLWDDVSNRPEYVSEEMAALLGMSVDQYFQEHRTPDDILARIHPEDRQAYHRATDTAIATATAYDIEFRMQDHHGVVRHWREIGEPLFDDAGNATRSFGTLQDVTAIKQAEFALRESEERMRGLLDNSPTSIVLKDRDGRFRLVNRHFLDRYGLASDDVLGKTDRELFSAEIAATQERLDQTVLATGRSCEEEVTVRLPDGEAHSIVLTRFPVFDDDHRVTGIGSIGLDVTAQRATEERLRQAQKMEAVGQLTGGVAHDFNNILAVILGNGEILQERLGPANDQSQAICRAASRGAELTQRLLAFSRKQPLHPEAVDLGRLVSGLLDLLQRTLGETIVIKSASEPDLWAAAADPGQLENAVLNLVLNARDAMPDGGVLKITASNVTLTSGSSLGDFEVAPGNYVMLQVSDSGCGIAPHALERVFEPFFTTKEVGEGSGLGLSMVYGFAKQSGGHVTIDSEPNHGTRVCLYLPRAEQAAPAAESTIEATPPPATGETILVLEDDPDVRALTTEMLRTLEYRVLEAQDGHSAIAVLEANRCIDLLLSDVVLPGGISGPELARMATESHPEMKCLFMSGYNHVSTRPCAAAPLQADLIVKPFRKRDLAEKLREILNATAS